MESPLPGAQQQPAGDGGSWNSEAVTSGSTWKNSGSIGPFFAVISVLTLLSVISCVIGRRCVGVPVETPLERIKARGHFGWLRRWFSLCMTHDSGVEAGGRKVAAASCDGN
ncbi:hypothetical protein Nepgr_033429 [Nepenthes gracilis]|uniref:Uncharacterized protein n=1 Tax=Nepenthes gracilis TaxID=150966 RepID=A0AAD3TL68_NEPGR|nr:hypothetical protein Nepgr_033429 [Nepenthes gracilis]